MRRSAPLSSSPWPTSEKKVTPKATATSRSREGVFAGRPSTRPMESAPLMLPTRNTCYQRIPPGYRFPYGHTHRKQEEVYLVVGGSGRMKLDDEIVELKQWDAVRVAPGTWRGYEAGPEGLEIIVIGAPSLGDARREDVEGQRDWWADRKSTRLNSSHANISYAVFC